MTVDAVGRARSFLFVPGDRPDRFAKAMASGADAVVLDLEDAVPAAHKRAALADVVRFADEADRRPGAPAVVIRVNAVGSALSDHELTTLAGVGRALAVMVPKAESAAALAHVVDRLPPGSGVVPLVETALGLLNVRDVASCAGALRLAFGHLDLCAQLGLSPDDERRLEPARFALVTASAAASLPPPVDGVSTAVSEADVTFRATRLALESGFTAKLCIHPRQVPVVHEALRPTEAELSWARTVLGTGAPEGVAVVDGEMVDRPVLVRATAILARARGDQGDAATDRGSEPL